MAYLFTDQKGRTIEIVNDDEWFAHHAEAYRTMLKRKLGKTIVSWAYMGGSNPNLKI